MESEGKQTARITACIRYGYSFMPPPLGQEIFNIDDSTNITIGYDQYAQYFALKTCRILLASPVIRWIVYIVSDLVPAGGANGHVIARHIIMDEIIVKEIYENNAKQLVILGAGYDSRALRFQPLFNKYKINVFEVDLPSTQSGKTSLLSYHNIQLPSYLTFVGVDFGKDDIKKSLISNGYQDSLQTVFVFEGVAPYLHAQELCMYFLCNVVYLIYNTNKLMI